MFAYGDKISDEANMVVTILSEAPDNGKMANIPHAVRNEAFSYT
jgi:hypothetical protein